MKWFVKSNPTRNDCYTTASGCCAVLSFWGIKSNVLLLLHPLETHNVMPGVLL